MESNRDPIIISKPQGEGRCRKRQIHEVLGRAKDVEVVLRERKGDLASIRER